MATDPGTVEFILEQAAGAGPVRARKMFGEYALYVGDNVVALICDDTLYFKPLPELRALMPGAREAPPYPGAKPHLVAEEELDDPERLAALVRAAEAALPAPKPKRKKGG